jgi:hypothetical protein
MRQNMIILSCHAEPFGRLHIASARCLFVPGRRFGKVLPDSLAFVINHAKVVLRLFIATFCQRLEFLERLRIIALHKRRLAFFKAGICSAR